MVINTRFLMSLLILLGCLPLLVIALGQPLSPPPSVDGDTAALFDIELNWLLPAGAALTALLLFGVALLLFLYTRLKKRLVKRSHELEHITRLLKKSERHLQAVLDGAYDGIISIDEQGSIENFNVGAEQIFGYQRSEVVGKNIDIIIPDNEKHEHRKVIKGAALKGKKVIQRARQLYGQSKCGELIPVEVTINRIVSDEQVKYVGVIRDVSDLTIERNNLVTALTEAEVANEAKNRLLSSASHELRTPLNAILGFSEILIADFDTISVAHRLEHLQDVHRSAELLLLLVNDVLDYAKLESGLIKLDLKPITFKRLLDESFRIMQAEIEKKQLDFIIDLKSNDRVFADYLRMQQVLLNLISNACKYNVDGGSIKVVAGPDESGHYCIDVIDSGIGIAEEKVPELFQPFSRLHDLRLPIEGNGLGLSLCKNLVESMGGSLIYRKNRDCGSTFSVCMPLAKNDELAGFLTADLVVAATNRCKILYVEDNDVNVRLMNAMLSRLNVDMDSVTSAEDCLDYLQQQRPDIILMDINLPGLSGREAAERIRQDSFFDEVPIIAVSASIADSEADSLFFDCIGKPFTVERIRSVIERAGQLTPADKAI